MNALETILERNAEDAPKGPRRKLSDGHWCTKCKCVVGIPCEQAGLCQSRTWKLNLETGLIVETSASGMPKVTNNNTQS